MVWSAAHDAAEVRPDAHEVLVHEEATAIAVLRLVERDYMRYPMIEGKQQLNRPPPLPFLLYPTPPFLHLAVVYEDLEMGASEHVPLEQRHLRKRGERGPPQHPAMGKVWPLPPPFPVFSVDTCMHASWPLRGLSSVKPWNLPVCTGFVSCPVGVACTSKYLVMYKYILRVCRIIDFRNVYKYV